MQQIKCINSDDRSGQSISNSEDSFVYPSNQSEMGDDAIGSTSAQYSWPVCDVFHSPRRQSRSSNAQDYQEEEEEDAVEGMGSMNTNDDAI